MSVRIIITVLVGCTISAFPSAAWAGQAIPKGYLLVQDVATYHTSRYGAISTAAEAEKIFSALTGKLDGVELGTLFYDKQDLKAHRLVAETASKYRIHCWATSFKLLERLRLPVPLEYQAWVMEPGGRIKPAVYPGDRASPAGRAILDLLNPQATGWFIGKYQEIYLYPFKGLLSGLFLNEDVISYVGEWSNDHRYDYWNNATYSPSVLEQWRNYCKANGVLYRGKVVDKFPVHRPEMVSQGSGMTAFYPGYDLPEKIYPGQRFTELPRPQGVWQHWYNFLGKIFIQNWLTKLAAAANQVNAGNPEWLGVVYFNIFPWSLPYEEIENPELRVPGRHRWGAWGKQRGIDLAYLSRQPEITAIICETYPPVADNLDLFVGEFQRIVRRGNKIFGLMLHRDDRWPLESAEEKARWQLLEKYQPTIIARIPLKHMLHWDQYFRREEEDRFNKKWREYRSSGN